MAEVRDQQPCWAVNFLIDLGVKRDFQLLYSNQVFVNEIYVFFCFFLIIITICFWWINPWFDQDLGQLIWMFTVKVNLNSWCVPCRLYFWKPYVMMSKLLKRISVLKFNRVLIMQMSKLFWIYFLLYFVAVSSVSFYHHLHCWCATVSAILQARFWSWTTRFQNASS